MVGRDCDFDEDYLCERELEFKWYNGHKYIISSNKVDKNNLASACSDYAIQSGETAYPVHVKDVDELVSAWLHAERCTPNHEGAPVPIPHSDKPAHNFSELDSHNNHTILPLQGEIGDLVEETLGTDGTAWVGLRRYRVRPLRMVLVLEEDERESNVCPHDAFSRSRLGDV